MEPGTDLGLWDPMPVDRIASLFDSAPFRWWVSGGMALELHVGESWRSHSDSDVGIRRTDCGAAYLWLQDWDLYIAAGGDLRRWNGGSLDPEADQNNVWIRTGSDSPWAVDLTVGDGDAQLWTYRRDGAVRRKWSEAILTTSDNVPYLAPDLQLLFKSKNTRPKDDIDARMVVPNLTDGQKLFLADHLPADHHWRILLSPQATRTNRGHSDSYCPGPTGARGG